MTVRGAKNVLGALGALGVLLCLGGAPSFAEPKPTDSRLKYSGVGTDPQTGKVLYREQHVLVMGGDQPKSSKTRYFGPKGDEWAILETQMTTSRDRFTHRFEDLRTGESYGVRLDRSGVPIMYTRDTRGDPFTRKPYRASKGDPVAVAGQGFHWLIRDQILKGKMKPSATLEFRLLIPGRFDYFSFKTVVHREKGDSVFISVKLASLFLRIVAGAEMKLVYSQSTGRLLEYLGPTSLVDESGKTIEHVRIRYTYPP